MSLGLFVLFSVSKFSLIEKIVHCENSPSNHSPVLVDLCTPRAHDGSPLPLHQIPYLLLLKPPEIVK